MMGSDIRIRRGREKDTQRGRYTQREVERKTHREGDIHTSLGGRGKNNQEKRKREGDSDED